jgi:ABC-type Fe3+ transport system permease subunit
MLSPLAPITVYLSQLRDGGWQVLPEVWRDNGPELFNTVVLSSVAAPLLILFALASVSSWKFWPPRRRSLALRLCALPLLFPPITLGIALVQFYNRDIFALVYGGLAPGGFTFLDWLSENSARYGMMLIGYAARFLPIAIVLLWEASRRVDDTLLEAAQNMGASPALAARTILLAQLRPALVGVAALLWAMTAAELTVSVLVNQPGGQTLPVPIFNLMHIGSTAQVAALSLTLFALTALAVAGMAFALNWKRKS